MMGPNFDPSIPLGVVGTFIVLLMFGEAFGVVKLHFAERKKRHRDRRAINFYIVERPLEVLQ